jgi:hypothetical protein
MMPYGWESRRYSSAYRTALVPSYGCYFRNLLGHLLSAMTGWQQVSLPTIEDEAYALLKATQVASGKDFHRAIFESDSHIGGGGY